MVDVFPVHLATTGEARVASVLATRVRRFRCDVIDGGEHREASWAARLGDVLAFLYGP